MEDTPQVTTQTKSKSRVKVAVALAGVLAAAAIIGYIALKYDWVRIQDPVLIKDPATINQIKDPATILQEGQNLPPIYSGQ